MLKDRRKPMAAASCRECRMNNRAYSVSYCELDRNRRATLDFTVLTLLVGLELSRFAQKTLFALNSGIEKIPVFAGIANAKSETLNLLLRLWLCILRAATWASARSSADGLNIDRGISRTRVLHITLDLHRFSHVWRQLRRIGVCRHIQFIGGASFVLDRVVRSAATQAALGDRCVRP